RLLDHRGVFSLPHPRSERISLVILTGEAARRDLPRQNNPRTVQNEGLHPNRRGGEMKRIILAAVLSGYATAVFAGGPSCREQPQEQKLAGSLLVQFMAQCEHDAITACDASAADLAGTAKASFTQKCVHHTVGMKSCTKLLRDSFRRQLVVRSLEADEETAML